MKGRGERGAAALEFAIIVPVLLVLIGLAVCAGRIAVARINVQQWADSAARTASISRDAGSARAQAESVVRSDVQASSVPCRGGAGVEVDTSAFRTPVGRPGTIRTTVRCALPLGNLVPGLPGTLELEGNGASPLDRYRGRR